MSTTVKYPSHPKCIKCKRLRELKKDRYKRLYASDSKTRGKYGKDLSRS